MPYADPTQRKAHRRAYYLAQKERLNSKEYLAKYADRTKRNRHAFYWRHADRLRADCRDRYHRIRREVLDFYGGCCQCCGESQIEFLTIDHMQGDGAQHRRECGFRGGLGLYRWLRKQGFPPGFQTLCWNCNEAKGRYGQCPHQAARR